MDIFWSRAMPLEYKILESRKLVYCVGSGVITFSDLMAHIEVLSIDPQYIPPMLKLVDYSKIESINLTPEESELFAHKKAALKDCFRDEKNAIVSPLDIGFGIARVHGTLTSFIDPNIETEAFKNINEALAWLGIESEDERILP